jgi:hypothetical protein
MSARLEVNADGRTNSRRVGPMFSSADPAQSQRLSSGNQPHLDDGYTQTLPGREGRRVGALVTSP